MNRFVNGSHPALTEPFQQLVLAQVRAWRQGRPTRRLCFRSRPGFTRLLLSLHGLTNEGLELLRVPRLTDKAEIMSLTRGGTGHPGVGGRREEEAQDLRMVAPGLAEESHAVQARRLVVGQDEV